MKRKKTIILLITLLIMVVLLSLVLKINTNSSVWKNKYVLGEVFENKNIEVIVMRNGLNGKLLEFNDSEDIRYILSQLKDTVIKRTNDTLGPGYELWIWLYADNEGKERYNVRYPSGDFTFYVDYNNHNNSPNYEVISNGNLETLMNKYYYIN